MESDSDRIPVGRTPDDELADVQRAMRRPHIDYPAIPAWVWPTLAVSAGVYAWSWTLDQPSPRLPVMVVGLAITFLVTGHITRARGNFPDFSTMPRRMKREAYLTWIQVIVLIAVVVLVWNVVGSAAGIAVSALGYAGIMFAHQRRHDAIAAELRAADRASATST